MYVADICTSYLYEVPVERRVKADKILTCEVTITVSESLVKNFFFYII